MSAKTQEMKTTSTLIKKDFKNLNADNEKLDLLDNQIYQMNDDYQEMKRTREEAKKQLEARFQDVYRKIQNTKDFILAEGKRINDTLLAFQSKFQTELKETADNFQKLHNDHVESMRKALELKDQQINDLNRKIDEEREERLKQSDANLTEIKKELESNLIIKIDLRNSLNTEKSDRINNDKEISKKLADESYAMKVAMENEESSRNMQVKEVKQNFDYEMEQQKHFTEDFHTKTREEFNHFASNLEKEMGNRFDHQDKIVENMSNVVKTLQDTMKVISSE